MEFMWFILAIFIGFWARNINRSGIAWFFISLLISPLISAIILLIIGDGNTEKCPSCKGKVDASAKVCMHCNYQLKPSTTTNNSRPTTVKKQSQHKTITQQTKPKVPTQKPDTKECPFCAETIKVAAIKCRFCGSELKAVTNTQEHSLTPTEEKLVEGVNTNNWGLVNSAIILGVKIDDVTIDGKHPLDVAKEHGDVGIINLIQKHSNHAKD